MSDPVNHPKHYTHGGIECIDVIEAWQLPYHLGNCLKYICRAGRKDNEIEDLKKALWYLRRYAAMREEALTVETMPLVDSDGHDRA